MIGTRVAPFALYACICVLRILLSVRFVFQLHHEPWRR
jgi:hypothetical protein